MWTSHLLSPSRLQFLINCWFPHPATSLSSSLTPSVEQLSTCIMGMRFDQWAALHRSRSRHICENFVVRHYLLMEREPFHVFVEHSASENMRWKTTSSSAVLVRCGSKVWFNIGRVMLFIRVCSWEFDQSAIQELVCEIGYGFETYDPVLLRQDARKRCVSFQHVLQLSCLLTPSFL